MFDRKPLTLRRLKSRGRLARPEVAATYNGRSAERSRIAVPKTVDAVYEGGVLRLLSPPDLPEHQRVRVTVDVAPDERPIETLRAWLGVYAGLAEEDVAEVAAIALARCATRLHP